MPLVEMFVVNVLSTETFDNGKHSICSSKRGMLPSGSTPDLRDDNHLAGFKNRHQAFWGTMSAEAVWYK